MATPILASSQQLRMANQTQITEDSRISLKLWIASIVVAGSIAGTGAVSLWKLSSLEESQHRQFEATEAQTLALNANDVNMAKLAGSLDRLSERMDGWQAQNKNAMQWTDFILYISQAKGFYPDLPDPLRASTLSHQ
jgi:hypothetical protein